MSQNLVFIIEHCENCQMHSWNTRHDANKYKTTALQTAEAIKKLYPNCEVVFNMVPKVWAHSDIYCQLIPNEDEAQPYYEVVPRIGTFEVSVNGTLLFSKLLSGLWPNFPAVGERCKQVADAIMRGEDPKDFQTTGFGQKAMGRKSRTAGGMGTTGTSFAPQQVQQMPPQQFVEEQTAAQEPAQAAPVEPEAPKEETKVVEEPKAEAPKEDAPKAEEKPVEAKPEEVKAEETKAAEAPKTAEATKPAETAKPAEVAKPAEAAKAAEPAKAADAKPKVEEAKKEEVKK